MRQLFVALHVLLKHRVYTGIPHFPTSLLIRPPHLYRSSCCRGLAHYDAQISIKDKDAANLLSEKTLDNINKALEEVGSEERVLPPSHVVLYQFFEQTKTIAQVVHLLRKGSWDEEVQSGLKSLGITYEPLLVTQVLRADISCDVALNFFQWLKRIRRYMHNEYTYGAMLNVLGRARRLHEMQQLLDEMKANACLVTPVTLSNVMLWYFKAKDVRRVADHWRMMRLSGAKLSPAIYASYIDFLVKTKHYTKIAVVFEEMLRIECLPNSRTYTVFIQCLVEKGKLDGAQKILQIMQTMHLVPTRVAYKILINTFAKTGDVDRVQELLGEMREHFHRPTIHFMPALKALQAAGKMEEAAILLKEIKLESSPNLYEIIESSDEEDVDDFGCSLSEWRAISCLHLGFDVNAFVRTLHTWNPQVEEVLEHANVQWERYLVMGIFRRLRNVDSLWPFFHWLKDKGGFKHDSHTCALLIQRIFKSKLSLGKKAFLMNELFEELRSEGCIKFTVPIFNLVIRYYVTAGEGDRAFSMFKLMKELELDPNCTSYTHVIEACAKNHQVEKVTELLKEVEEKGLHLSSSACAKYITCLASLGKLSEAYAFFSSMQTFGRQHPSPVEYKAIIAAYDRAGDNAMALQLYDKMREVGITPTQDMHEVVTRILRQADRLSDVHALEEERKLLNFFEGNKKELQEKLLQVLFLFMENIKPRRSQKSHPATS